MLRRPIESTQYTSADYTQELTDHRVLGSIGSVGDAYDNALAESFVDTFKTELIADRVWRTRSQLELAIVEYVGWFNTARLHESLGDIPPAEFEALYSPDEPALTAPASGMETSQSGLRETRPASARPPVCCGVIGESGPPVPGLEADLGPRDRREPNAGLAQVGPRGSPLPGCDRTLSAFGSPGQVRCSHVADAPREFHNQLPFLNRLFQTESLCAQWPGTRCPDPWRPGSCLRATCSRAILMHNRDYLSLRVV